MTSSSVTRTCSLFFDAATIAGVSFFFGNFIGNTAEYFIPFAILFGIFGLIYHFLKDWKRGLAVLSLFAATGLMIILYLNQYDPQPRERDYSYVGSFFAFSIWIGIGVAALAEFVQKLFNDKKGISVIVSLSVVSILMPVTMLKTDFKEHNRSGNYVAWDYAYNMLNSLIQYQMKVFSYDI